MLWTLIILLFCGVHVLAIDDDTVELALQNSEFGFDMYKRIAEEDDAENIFFSPYSISAAMAMVHLGSRGDTKEEIAEVLGFEDDVDTNFEKLIGALFDTDTDSQVILKSANKFYGKQDTVFLESFTDALKEYYDSDGEMLDFEKQPEAARQTINQWVESKTENTISELFGEGTIDSSTVMVLVNALYFKANWKIQFDRSLTQDGTFTHRDGSTSSLPMMNLVDDFRMTDAPDYKMSILELPYDGDTTAMYILLPKDGVDIADVEDSMTGVDLSDIIEDMYSTEVSVSLPKFEVTQQMELNSILEALGVEKVFSTAADLSGITGHTGLYVTDVVHQAFVKIDEEGTEASAATGISIGFKSVRQNSFTVNRPFLFVIRDMATGSNLFMGRIVNPTTTTRPLKLRMMRRSALTSGGDQVDDNGGASAPMATVTMVILSTIAALSMKQMLE